MINFLLPLFFLSSFGFFSLLGIKQSLAFTQLINIFISIILFILIKKIGRNFFKSNVTFFYWLFIFLLIFTYIIGIEVKGSKRWIDLYFFNFQASEFFKVFFIIFLADFFSKNYKDISRIKTLIASLFYFFLPTLIIFKQPDLGNAIIYVLIFLTIIVFSGVPKKALFYLFTIFLLSLPLLWLMLKNYQRDRILSFFNPNLDQKGTAYNMIQSIITLGSGKLFGRGLGLGTQSRLYFLPENRTDFAFASLIEQFGFFGGLVNLLMYLLISIYIFKKALNFYFKREDDSQFNFLFVIGFFAYFIFQVFINIGMNLGILPVAGVVLPFISYGGSAIVSLMVGFALLP